MRRERGVEHERMSAIRLCTVLAGLSIFSGCGPSQETQEQSGIVQATDSSGVRITSASAQDAPTQGTLVFSGRAFRFFAQDLILIERGRGSSRPPEIRVRSNPTPTIHRRPSAR